MRLLSHFVLRHSLRCSKNILFVAALFAVFQKHQFFAVFFAMFQKQPFSLLHSFDKLFKKLSFFCYILGVVPKTFVFATCFGDVSDGASPCPGEGTLVPAI